MAFSAASKPASLLAYYRVMSPNAGVRVSPLCLGTMNFGNKWAGFMGECDKKTSFGILDHFFKSGGNFLDTANNYQGEESEAWIGEWMKERNNRDQIVIATKFSSVFPADPKHIKVNFSGNHSKSILVSINASLKKLQTEYVDILYLHWWDFTTSIPELMRALHVLITSGKVLYLGISDTPAWVVSKANEYARQQGLTPFSIYQGHWSALVRDFERDILPMCESEGMAICPWGTLGRGLFKTPDEHEKTKDEGRQMGGPNEKSIAVSKALDNIAKTKRVPIVSIALAYIMHKYPYVYPIIGGRKTEHLQSNIEALGIELSPEDIESIDGAVPFDIGFPMSMLFEYGGKQKFKSSLTYGDVPLSQAAGAIDAVNKTSPVKPHGN